MKNLLGVVYRRLLKNLSERELKGEFTVVVEGAELSVKNQQDSTNIDIDDLLLKKETNQSLRQELKEIASQTGKSVKEVYQLYLENQKK